LVDAAQVKEHAMPTDQATEDVPTQAGGGGINALQVLATHAEGRGRYRVTARLGDQPIHTDVLNVSAAARRAQFIGAVLDALKAQAPNGMVITMDQLAAFRTQLESQVLTLADHLAAAGAANGQAGADPAEFTNVAADGRGRLIGAIANELFHRTGGWPRRVGAALFFEGADGKPGFITSPNDLFAWARQRLGRVVWERGPDRVSPEEFYHHLGRAADGYEAVEQVPHWPPLPGIFYMIPEVPPGDGTYLEAFLDLFNPATSIDRALLKAYLLTPVWGGAPGKRPAFLITGPEVDEHQGRGVGKSTFVTATAPLFGGYLMATPREEMPAVVKRLLSPEGRGKRIVLLDNLKTLRFSWADLEGFITAPVISGHEMYKGEGQRPNTTTVAITINGASLSKDMARRCVIIRLARPVYQADWAVTVGDFVAEFRQQILGDLRGVLEADIAGTPEVALQWADWEAQVLARVKEAQECRAVILERQAAVDDDASDAQLVAEQFRAMLKRSKHEPDRCYVLIPRKLAGKWLEAALGDSFTTSKARAILNNLGIPELRESASDGKRGWCWTGAKANNKVKMKVLEEWEEWALGPICGPPTCTWPSQGVEEECA
jgi:hypothetical protein